MSNRTTRKTLENALRELQRYFPNEKLCLDMYERRYRVIREDNSRPFGSNYYSANLMLEVIWRQIDALRLASVPRTKYLGEE